MTDKLIFAANSSTDMLTFPIATAKQMVFLAWNLIVDFISSTFCTNESLCVIAVGNLPALFNPGP